MMAAVSKNASFGTCFWVNGELFREAKNGVVLSLEGTLRKRLVREVKGEPIPQS